MIEPPIYLRDGVTSFQIFSSRLDDQVTKELLGIFPFSVLQDFTTIDLIKGEKPKGQNGSRNFTFGLVNLIRNFLLQIFFIGWTHFLIPLNCRAVSDPALENVDKNLSKSSSRDVIRRLELRKGDVLEKRGWRGIAVSRTVRPL